MCAWARADHDACLGIEARESRLLRCVQEECPGGGAGRVLQTVQVVDMQQVQIAARGDPAAPADPGDAAAGDLALRDDAAAAATADADTGDAAATGANGAAD